MRHQALLAWVSSSKPTVAWAHSLTSVSDRWDQRPPHQLQLHQYHRCQSSKSYCQHLYTQPRKASLEQFPHQQFRRRKPKLTLALPPLRTAPSSYAISGVFYTQKLAIRGQHFPRTAVKPKTAVRPKPVHELSLSHK